jgi:hypothetical protein
VWSCEDWGGGRRMVDGFSVLALKHIFLLSTRLRLLGSHRPHACWDGAGAWVAPGGITIAGLRSGTALI